VGATLPSWCSEALLETRCAVVALELSPEADDGLYDDTWPSEDCVFTSDRQAYLAPEEAITRTVWSADQIVASRDLVVGWECFRMFGTPDCDDDRRVRWAVSDSIVWDSPFADRPPQRGGFFLGPDVPDEAWRYDPTWWMHFERYAPTSVLPGQTLVGCWGDPRTGEPDNLAVVGGDCAQATGEGEPAASQIHRDLPEGPTDLVAVFRGDPAACDVCLDGVDNNCNGVADRDEPACAQCFVGSSCVCTTGSPPSPTTVVGLLLLLGLRRRERSRRAV
jgi:MYXO-CTERM domain-containing protein